MPRSFIGFRSLLRKARLLRCPRTARSNVHPEYASARGFFARLASGTFLIRLQDGWRRAGEFVDLKEVYPPVPDADKIQFVEMDDLGEKAYAKKKQEYKKLFLR